MESVISSSVSRDSQRSKNSVPSSKFIWWLLEIIRFRLFTRHQPWYRGSALQTSFESVFSAFKKYSIAVLWSFAS